MFKHLEGARLGIFIFLGTVLFVVAIFMIGSKKSIFVKSYTVKTYFTDVQGLKTGAAVRLSGINVGSVTSIKLTGDTASVVEVTMSIDKELSKFIRLDSEAAIETEGLIGSKIVAITPGSPNLAEIENGGVIKSKAPVNFGKIIEETQGIMAYTKEITKNFSEIVEKVNKGNGTLGKIVNDDKLYYASVDIIRTADTTLTALTDQFDKVSDIILKMGEGTYSILANVDSVTVDIKRLIAHVENGEGVLGALISDRSAYDSIKTVINKLASTMEAARLGTEAFWENMEALKHNWLFKSYFEERGYWDRPKYEKEIDLKLKELKEQEEKINKKLEELKALEKKLTALQNQKVTE